MYSGFAYCFFFGISPMQQYDGKYMSAWDTAAVPVSVHAATTYIYIISISIVLLGIATIWNRPSLDFEKQKHHLGH
jgi:hypothetical protein